MLRVSRYSELGQILSQFMREQYQGVDDGDCVAIGHSSFITHDEEKLVMSCQGNHIYIGIGLVRGFRNKLLTIKFNNFINVDVEIKASKYKRANSPLLADDPNSTGMKELFSWLCLATGNQENRQCKSFTIRSQSATELALMIHFRRGDVLFDIDNPHSK